MDGLALSASSFFTRVDLFSPRRGRRRNLSFLLKPNKFVALASKEEPQFDQWDEMELKFGRLLGEDPKLTLAKIMSRKVNPGTSYLEVEKSFYKQRGKLKGVEELPFDESKNGESSISSDDVNLVRPVLKKGMKFETEDKSLASGINKPSQSVRKPAVAPTRTLPNVILRKPKVYNEDDAEETSSRLKIKPNLTLKMRNEPLKEKFSNMTLLKKPEPIISESNEEPDKPSSSKDINLFQDFELLASKIVPEDSANDLVLLKKPESMAETTKLENNLKELVIQEANFVEDEETKLKSSYIFNDNTKEILGNIGERVEESSIKELELNVCSETGLPPEMARDIESNVGAEPAIELSENILVSTVKLSPEAALQQKPNRLDPSTEKVANLSTASNIIESYANEAENIAATSATEVHENEEANWIMAEALAKGGDRAEVEIINSSTRGFVVSFGPLVGFLPYRNLAARWKFLAFESWLRKKGLDPSMYKQNLSIVGRYDGGSNFTPSGSDPDVDIKIEGVLSPDMKLEDLLRIYDQEKTNFLSSFIGQKIKVHVVLANQKSRKLIFSLRPKEKEELIEKKRSLMAKLQVGDVVKCCVKKITYFGIFVEIEGVSALIHQSEISWDSTVDPTIYFKIGQIVEAKVQQLNFSLERIFLSLKEIMPDPLSGALNSVVGDQVPSVGEAKAAELDPEWADVETLVKELKEIKGIQSVSKGRFFLSPGLAPTFQVYMASMYENQYKLLARSGNKVQEVIVQTSLNKEEIREAILTCTSKVE